MTNEPDQDTRTIPGLNRISPWIVVYVVVVLGLPFISTGSGLFLFSLLLIFAVLGISAVVSIGYSGQLIIAHGAFFGIGAYSYVKFVAAGVPSWGSIVLATIVTTLITGALGATALRATGIYLGIITLAFNELFVIVLDLFPGFFGGSAGVSSSKLAFGPLTSIIPNSVLMFWVTALTFGVVFLATARLLNSPYGWAFQTLHERPEVSESIGINTPKMRTLTFALTGAICGIAGSFYAPLLGYISPSLFNLEVTVQIIMVAVIGGMVILEGSLIGGAFVIFLPELLRFMRNWDNFVFGLVLIIFLIFIPDGVGSILRNRIPDLRRRLNLQNQEE